MFVGLPVAAATRHPGALPPLLLFDASFVLMLSLVLPQPRRYGYTFLAVFLFLGFWAKFNLHTLTGYDYSEPIGAFDGSGSSWDEALLVSAFGALGVSVARLVQLAIAPRRQREAREIVDPPSSKAPGWYETRRRLLWVGTVCAAVLLNVTNVFFDWFQIGVDANIDLPLYGNVAMGWTMKLGFALWLATLIFWESGRPDANLGRLLLVPVVEAAAVTTTCLSRGIYLYRVLPYVVVVAEQRRRFLQALGLRRLCAVAAVAVAVFVAALVAVSALRLVVYPSDVPEAASTTPVLAPTGASLDPGACRIRVRRSHWSCCRSVEWHGRGHGSHSARRPRDGSARQRDQGGPGYRRERDLPEDRQRGRGL